MKANLQLLYDERTLLYAKRCALNALLQNIRDEKLDDVFITFREEDKEDVLNWIAHLKLIFEQGPDNTCGYICLP